MNRWLVAALVGAGLAVAGPAFAAMPAKTANTANGTAFVNVKGMTLYTFDKDGKDKSNCTGGCASFWPPYLASAGAVPMGAWSLVKRANGSEQWAYDGQPLYTFARDKKPGDAKGDGFKGVWHIARP